jgi:hypothetical protein
MSGVAFSHVDDAGEQRSSRLRDGSTVTIPLHRRGRARPARVSAGAKPEGPTASLLHRSSRHRHGRAFEMLDVFCDGFDARVAWREGVEAVEFPTSAWRLARERYPEVVRAP